jgi:hypothetical protein
MRRSFLAVLRVVAAAAAIECAGAPATAGEESFGRLFFTPEERHALDRQRQYAGAGNSRIKTAPAVDGVVVRSSGKRTVWLNGAARHDARTPDGVVVTTRSDDPAAITIAADGDDDAKVRVGARADQADGADVLGGGRLDIHRRSFARKMPP